MLQSCEVAIAYFMALSYSPQAQWLEGSVRPTPLLVRGLIKIVQGYPIMQLFDGIV